MISRNGVAYILKDSPYKLEVLNITYYFSTAGHKAKFKALLYDNRKQISESLSNRFKMYVNLKLLSDLNLYRKIETRGFYIENEGVGYECPEEVALIGVKRIVKKSQTLLDSSMQN